MVLVVVFLLSLTLSIACKKKDKTSESVGGSESVSFTESISGTQSESKVNSGKDSEKTSENKSTTESLAVSETAKDSEKENETASESTTTSESETVSDSKTESETVSESEKASESENGSKIDSEDTADSEETADSDNSSESEQESEIVYSEGLEYELNSDGNSYTVVGIGSFKGTELNIPEEYNGKPITKIGSRAFYDCDFLTSITTGKNVVNIGSYAFAYCDYIRSVVITDKVKEIEECAFDVDSRLAEVINKSSIKIEKGSEANGSIGLFAIVIHNGKSKIETIGEYIFLNDDEANHYLLGYTGSKSEITLPESYKGEKYEISTGHSMGRKPLRALQFPIM